MGFEGKRFVVSSGLYFLIGSLIVLVNLGWYIPITNIIRESIALEERETAIKGATAAQTFLDLKAASLRIIARALSDTLASQENKELVSNLLREQNFTRVFLADIEGTEVFVADKFATVFPEEYTHIQDDSVLREGVTEPSFGVVEITERFEPIMTITVPVFATDGKKIGALGAVLSVKSAFEAIQEITLEGQGTVFAVDEKGVLIAHKDVSLVLKNTDYSNLPIVREVLTTEQATSDTSSRFIRQDENGINVRSSAAHVHNARWVVVFEHPEKEAMRAIYIVSILLGLIVLFGLGIFFILRRINVDLQKTKDRLASQKTRLDAIIASINEGILVIDTNMGIHLINAAAKKMLEITDIDVTGHPLNGFVKTTQKGKSLFADAHPIAKTLREGTSFLGTLEDDYAFQLKSGRIIPIAFATAPLYEGATISGAVVAFRNITAEKQFDESRNSFISVASHQLRTPLTSMRWYVEMVRDGDAGATTEKQQDFLGEAYQGILRLTDTLDMLLALSRIESGRTKAEAKDIDLHAYMKAIVNEQAPLFAEKKLKVICSCAEGYAPHVFLDPILLRQAVLNLISNAVRYSNPEGRIEISLTSQNRSVVCSVKDEGIGIPEEYKEKIFEKFFRAKNAVSKVPEGNGLGLNLIKSLVEMWGGRVWFESPARWDEGGTQTLKGSVFHFSIPHIDNTKQANDNKEVKENATEKK